MQVLGKRILRENSRDFKMFVFVVVVVIVCVLILEKLLCSRVFLVIPEVRTGISS